MIIYKNITTNNKNIFFIFLFLPIFLYSTSISNGVNKDIKKIIQTDEQRKIFNEQEINKNKIFPKSNQFKKLEIKPQKKENCVKIKNINIIGSTIYKQSNFKDLIKPILNTCQGMTNLTNLTNKISNIYIEDGYITSRAYIKPQNLANGKIEISILEGKVEKIISEKINSKNLYANFENRILNIRDIEVGVQQAERLKSQSVSLKLLPGTKTGYTIIQILSKKVSKEYYGNISIDNFGSKQTGKYQINTNFNYENLLDLSDILSAGLYGTNHMFKNTNNFSSASLSYSIPYQKALFSFDYYYSKYKQSNKDEFDDIYNSDGNSNSYTFQMDYKLFHNQNQSLELTSGFEHKTSNNYLNEVKLDIQSYKLSILNLGLKHTYNTNSISLYSIINVYKGLNILGAKNNFADQKSDFTKYVLDLNLTKYFESKYKTKYNISFRGQLSKDRLFGTEEISMGGPYSVRGFKESGLSGRTGFYVRNELSTVHDFKPYILSPYLGLDYGYIKKDEDSLDGSIIGSALGLRANYKNSNLDIFYTKYLNEAPNIKNQNKNFLGIKYSYEF